MIPGTEGTADAEQPAPDYIPATYAEIQAHFGLGSTDAARMKAKRRRWHQEPPNRHGGLSIVRVPRDEWTLPEQPERSPIVHRERSPQPNSLKPILEIVREERDRLLDERDRLIAERDRAQADAATLRQEREEARVRAAQAEGEARALREALEDARRPFWRRWIG